MQATPIMNTENNSAVSESTDATVKELKALLAEAEGVLSATGSEAAAGVAALRDRAKVALEKCRETASHALEDAKEAAKARAAEADKAIHEHPYVAIGVAAAMGLLLGALLSRGDHR